MSHFTRLNRLLHNTDVFQFSRLFHRQWRTNPAVAVASLNINAYTRRSVLTALNADVAPTTVGVTYLRFMENVNIYTCPLCIHHKHICACNKTPIIHKSLFCRGQTRNFVECDPGPQKTLKCRIWVLTVVRKCDPGKCINSFCAFHTKTSCSHIAL